MVRFQIVKAIQLKTFKEDHMFTKVARILLCGFFMLAACSGPAQAPSATPVPPTATAKPPTATHVPPTPEPTTVPADVIASIDKMLNNLTDQSLFSGAVLIAQNGKVLLNQGYGLADREKKIAITPETKFRVGSTTMQFTAMAILILASQGKLKVTDLICQYVSDCPPTWKDITIHHLLSHTSGLQEYSFQGSYTQNEKLTTPSTPEQLLAHIKDKPLAFQTGEGWYYADSNYVLLGTIIEKISGQPYAEFLKQNILTPLNMNSTGIEQEVDGLALGYRDAYTTTPFDMHLSREFACGDLYSTTMDLYLWEQSLSTEKLVPQAYLDQMFANQIYIEDEWYYDDYPTHYGYGWFIGERYKQPMHWSFSSFVVYFGTPQYSMLSTRLARYPKAKLTIIVLTNSGAAEETESMILKKIFTK